MSGPMARARTGWGDPLPDWIEALAKECASSSQSKVAARLDRSGALVSNVLAGTYTGDMEAIEERVRKLLLADTVNCPALGPMTPDACQMWRDRWRNPAPSNTLNVTMLRACGVCPRNTEPDTTSTGDT